MKEAKWSNIVASYVPGFKNKIAHPVNFTPAAFEGSRFVSTTLTTIAVII
ncbi:MAG TPA: hypothetical protein VJ991_03875 [Balneolales bacterium]|nr:hypothetical protein [Balneolales bacterium]